MATTRNLAPFDTVELIESVDKAPQGARGGLLDLLGEGRAIVEVMEPDLEGLDRIVYVHLDQLRLVKADPRRNGATS